VVARPGGHWVLEKNLAVFGFHIGDYDDKMLGN
jgi:hypothetical protein